MRTLIILLAFFAVAVQAGPNWEAIEGAREAKAVEKQAAREQAVQQVEAQQQKQSAYEKLVAACNKVESNAELTAACEEIKAAYKDLAEANK